MAGSIRRLAFTVLVAVTASACTSSSPSTNLDETGDSVAPPTVNTRGGHSDDPRERVRDATSAFDVLDIHLENHSGSSQLAIRVFEDGGDIGEIQTIAQNAAGESDEVLVSSCPFTRNEKESLATFIESDSWRADDSQVVVDHPFEIGGAAGETIGRGMWQDCVAFLSVRNATPQELESLEVQIQGLTDSYMIWTASGSCEQGWYDELLPLSTDWSGAGPNGLSECG